MSQILADLAYRHARLGHVEGGSLPENRGGDTSLRPAELTARCPPFGSTLPVLRLIRSDGRSARPLSQSSAPRAPRNSSGPRRAPFSGPWLLCTDQSDHEPDMRVAFRRQKLVDFRLGEVAISRGGFRRSLDMRSALDHAHFHGPIEGCAQVAQRCSGRTVTSFGSCARP